MTTHVEPAHSLSDEQEKPKFASYDEALDSVRLQMHGQTETTIRSVAWSWYQGGLKQPRGYAVRL